MTRKEELIKTIENAIGCNHRYIGIEVRDSRLKESEIIINPRRNFKAKLEYYKKAYDDDLKLKACSDISIVSFSSTHSYFRLQRNSTRDRWGRRFGKEERLIELIVNVEGIADTETIDKLALEIAEYDDEKLDNDLDFYLEMHIDK